MSGGRVHGNGGFRGVGAMRRKRDGGITSTAFRGLIISRRGWGRI